MVLFDLLHISDDGKKLYLNFHINKADYFKDLTLKSLTIIPADKVSETDPAVPTEDHVYQKYYDTGQISDALVLQPTDFNENFAKSTFSKDLFFVYVEVQGTPDICTPCRLDEQTTLGVTFDEQMLHQLVMQFTKELNQNCKIPKGFIDLILLLEGFKAAVETEHYIEAVGFWKKLFGNRNGIQSVDSINSCGCNG